MQKYTVYYSPRKGYSILVRLYVNLVAPSERANTFRRERNTCAELEGQQQEAAAQLVELLCASLALKSSQAKLTHCAGSL